jgi:S1-C subfamily serine protease
MAHDLLVTLSDRITTLAAQLAAHVVRVEGRRRGAGSGVVWSEDGLVVTAHHALDRDDEVEVGLPSGDTAVAEVVGRDPSTDLAALRVRGTTLSPAAWSESESPLAAGALVLGVTRPGRSPRVSLGLVTRAAGEYRGPAGGRLDRYLETSLDLHHGLSGGLVASAAGAPLGLATAGLVRGTAMIVPTETLRRVVASLVAHGAVRRGYLGVATFPVRLPPDAATAAGQGEALLVSAVEPDSPAGRAGLLLGDALLSLAGTSLSDMGDLLPLLEEPRIGETVPLRLVRAGEVREVSVTIGAREHGRRP